MGATCSGVEAGCCRGNTGAEEIVSIASNTKQMGNDRVSISETRLEEDDIGDKSKGITPTVQTKGGPIQDDRLEEVKELMLADNVIYTGQVLKGTQIRQGFGTQIFSDGARYVGEWNNDKVEGKGTFFHTNGDLFEGTFKEDKANGHGAYTHNNGQKYVGDWINDMQDGEGVEVLADGS